MQSEKKHVVLLGDSIFDNAAYVPDRPPVIEQLRQALPANEKATLLALDGAIIEDVLRQLQEVPEDATHLVVSVGGNDALSESAILLEAASTVGDALSLLHEVQARFAASYRNLLQELVALRNPAAVCTVYDSVPGLTPAEKTALAGFNETILREAFLLRLPVIDLRLICDQPGDYSHVSPIEPSAVGGAKIVQVIAQMVANHDFQASRSVIYA